MSNASNKYAIIILLKFTLFEFRAAFSLLANMVMTVLMFFSNWSHGINIDVVSGPHRGYYISSFLGERSTLSYGNFRMI